MKEIEAEEVKYYCGLEEWILSKWSPYPTHYINSGQFQWFDSRNSHIAVYFPGSDNDAWLSRKLKFLFCFSGATPWCAQGSLLALCTRIISKYSKLVQQVRDQRVFSGAICKAKPLTCCTVLLALVFFFNKNF